VPLFLYVQVSWNPHARSCLSEKSDKQPVDLVSTDTSDSLIMWDVEKCRAVSRFTHPEFKSLLSIKWSNGADVWQKSKVFLLYSNSNFVVLDIVTQAYQNILIETVPYPGHDHSVFDFDSEPASSTSSSIAFLGEHSLYIKNNWDPLKMKQERIAFSKSLLYAPKSASPRKFIQLLMIFGYGLLIILMLSCNLNEVFWCDRITS